MSKKVISTTNAPGAIGPYSQAIRVGDFLFTSGQVALTPSTGDLVTGGIEAETRQALANLTAVLTAGGATWADVAKTTIFLVDMADFAIVNRLYGEVAVTPAPARSTVQVAALPRGARVEIEAIAYLGKTSAPAT
jgi:2-iminobutanoate/2-iminopropanoate deaminase